MSWLDGLSAGLTAGTQGAAGWLQGQEKGRKEAEDRAKELAAALRQKHQDELAEAMQAAQIGRWTKDDARNQRLDERTGQLDIMKGQQEGYRDVEKMTEPTAAMKAAPSLLDKNFADIIQSQAKDAVTLGGRRFAAPLENPIERAMREKSETAMEKDKDALTQHKFRMKEIAANREDQSGGWSISDKYVDDSGQPVMVSARTGEIRNLDGSLVKKVGAAGSGGAGGGKTTDAQKKTNAFLLQAKQAVAGLDGDTVEGQPKTLTEALAMKSAGGDKSLGMFSPSIGRQIMSNAPLGFGNVMSGNKLRHQLQYSRQLSDAWLRYTSGAAVPEQEVERFRLTFVPIAGDDPATKKQKRAARAMIIQSMEAGVGYTPWRGDGAAPIDNPYRLPGQPKMETRSISPSAPPTDYQVPNTY